MQQAATVFETERPGAFVETEPDVKVRVDV